MANGTGQDVNYAAQELEQRRRLAMPRPRLQDRIQDDPREAPYIPDTQAGDTSAPGFGTPASSIDQPPPQPRLAQRVLGGFEGQPGGGTGGIVGRMARGALSGALGPTQRQDIEAERLGSQRVAGELATGSQRGGQEMALERQREAYGQPEQAARIEQQRLASKILEQRLQMMQGAGGGEGLSDLNDDENALLQSAYATGDPKTIEQAVGRIYSRRSIEGMVGPGTNVYDPNSPGGVARQFQTRGGQPMPGSTVRGAVVPGTLPTSTSQERLVTSPTGQVQAVGTTGTKTPQIPGAARPAGGGGGVRDTGATGVTGFGGAQAKALDKYVTNYRDIAQLEREQQDILKQAGQGYLNGPQSMQFLANHMALTVGRIKGARTGRELIEAHIKARDLGQDLDAIASRILAGGVLTNSQARQMLGTTSIKRTESLRTLREQADSAGMDVQVNDATGAVRVVPRAAR